jgi:hypothetical protein
MEAYKELCDMLLQRSDLSDIDSSLLDWSQVQVHKLTKKIVVKLLSYSHVLHSYHASDFHINITRDHHNAHTLRIINQHWVDLCNIDQAFAGIVRRHLKKKFDFPNMTVALTVYTDRVHIHFRFDDMQEIRRAYKYFSIHVTDRHRYIINQQFSTWPNPLIDLIWGYLNLF